MADYDFSDRVTRPTSAVPRTGIRAQPATLGRIPAGQEAEVTTPTDEELAYKAAYFITNKDRFANMTGYRYRSGAEISVPGLNAIVTIVKVLEDNRERDSYAGEYDMGSEGDIGIIFKVDFYGGSTIHLKKEGYSDSYGNDSWDGPFRLVVPKTKTVTEYVYDD
jgi:hypothetical protein